MTSFVGHAEYVGNTGALPAGVQPGDLAVVFTYCATSAVAIGGATGWSNGPDSEQNGIAIYVALRMLNGTENGSLPTFAGATHVAVQVFRGAQWNPRLDNGDAYDFSYTYFAGTSVSTPGLNMGGQDGTSWLAHFVAAKATNCNALSLPGTTDAGSTVGALDLSYAQNLKQWPATAYTGTLNAAGAIWCAIEIIKVADFAPVSFQAVTKAQVAVTAPTRFAVYLSSANDTLVATARTLLTTAPSSETSAQGSGQTTKSGTGWVELWSQGRGTATVTPAASEPTTPTGQGFILDSTALEGGQFPADVWRPSLKVSAPATGFVGVCVAKIWKRSSAGAYTLIARCASSSVTVGTSATVCAFTATAGSLTNFNAGDKLYVEVLFQITTGSSNNTATNRVISLYENGGLADSIIGPAKGSQAPTVAPTASAASAATAGLKALVHVSVGARAAAAATASVAVPTPMALTPSGRATTAATATIAAPSAITASARATTAATATVTAALVTTPVSLVLAATLRTAAQAAFTASVTLVASARATGAAVVAATTTAPFAATANAVAAATASATTSSPLTVTAVASSQAIATATAATRLVTTAGATSAAIGAARAASVVTGGAGAISAATANATAATVVSLAAGGVCSAVLVTTAPTLLAPVASAASQAVLAATALTPMPLTLTAGAVAQATALAQARVWLAFPMVHVQPRDAPALLDASSLPSGLVWQLNAETLGLTDGTPVASWLDSSPSGFDADASGALEPMYRAHVVNNALPAVSFTSDRMTIRGLGTWLSGRADYSLSWALAETDFSASPVFLAAPTGADYQWMIRFTPSGDVQLSSGNGYVRTFSPASVPLTQGVVLSVVQADGAEPRLWVNGTEIPGVPSGPNGDAQQTVPALGPDVVLGGYYDGSSPLNGFVGEVLMFDSALVDTDRQTVESYLTRWVGTGSGRRLMMQTQAGINLLSGPSVTFRNQSSVNFPGSTSVVLTKPTGTVLNDLLVLMFLAGAGSTSTATPPAGFALPTVTSGPAFPMEVTAEGVVADLWVWVKVAGSSEPASYTVPNNASGGCQAWLGSWSTVDPNHPVEFCVTNRAASGTTSSVNGGTAANPGDGIVFLEYDFGDNSALLTPPAQTPPTLTGRYVAQTGTNQLLVVADGIMSSAGATAATFSMGNNVAGGGWGAVLLGLNVAPGTTPAALTVRAAAAAAAVAPVTIPTFAVPLAPVAHAVAQATALTTAPSGVVPQAAVASAQAFMGITSGGAAIAPTADATSHALAALTAPVELNVIAAAASGTTAIISPPLTAAAAVASAATATVTAALLVPAFIGPTATATAAATADVDAPGIQFMAGGADATAAATATLTAQTALAAPANASTAALLTVSAALVTTPVPVAPAAAGASAATVALRAPTKLTATAAAVGQAQGQMIVGVSLSVVGAASAAAVATPVVTVGVALTATATSQAQVFMVAGAISIVVSADATSTATVIVTVAAVLSASASTATQALAATTAQALLAPNPAAAQTAAQAAFTTVPQLGPTARSTTASSVTVGYTPWLTLTATAAASTTGYAGYGPILTCRSTAQARAVMVLLAAYVTGLVGPLYADVYTNRTSVEVVDPTAYAQTASNRSYAEVEDPDLVAAVQS